MVVLGIVAVIAIVGLVLLFVQHKNSMTGQGIYGGAIEGATHPYWEGRGVPQNRPETQWAADQSDLRDLTTHYNYGSLPKRLRIPSEFVKCMQNGILLPYSDGQIDWYVSRGWTAVDTPDKAGACVYMPGDQTLVGGVV